MISPSKTLVIGNFCFVPYVKDGWQGWVASDWSGFGGFEDVEAWLSEGDGAVVLDTACRTIKRHCTSKGAVYSKLMRAQNDGVLKKNELFSKFKWMFYPSRARSIIKTTAMMLEKGHNCPRPVLGVRRSSFPHLPTDLYIATELTDPTVEERLAQAKDESEREELMGICARNLQRFHSDGFVHGDFLPRNTCLSLDNRTFSFLDNDRTHLRPHVPFFHFKRRNLTQFCYSLYALANDDDPRLSKAFVNAYGEAAQWTRARCDSEVGIILQQNDIRWKELQERRRRRMLEAQQKQN